MNNLSRVPKSIFSFVTLTLINYARQVSYEMEIKKMFITRKPFNSSYESMCDNKKREWKRGRS